MNRKRKDLVSAMGRSTTDQISVLNRDLCADILGNLNLGEFAFLEVTGRVPTSGESVVFNAMLATLVEHGMTPSAITARMTYLGAPESLQAAVAAGLCGMGTTFAGTAEGAACILQRALAEEADPQLDLRGVAKRIATEHVETRRTIPGIGHPVHKPIDPRTPRLFQIAEANQLSGRYVKLMQYVSEEAEIQLGKPGQLPVNATGALGALASELSIPWQLCRGLAVIGRAVGLVGHIAEEIRNPLAREIWLRAEEEIAANYGVNETSGENKG
jgi:citrate synthase